MNKLHDIKCFCLDMDGTIYLSDVVFKGALAAVERMQRQGRVIFLTNNSSRTRDEYYHKLNKLGFKIAKSDIYGSGNATIDYLNAFYPKKNVYLMGCQPLIAEFKAAGINICNVLTSSPLGTNGATDPPVNNGAATLLVNKAYPSTQSLSGGYDKGLACNNADCAIDANYDKNNGENSPQNSGKVDVSPTTKINDVKNKDENSPRNCDKVDVAVVAFDKTLTYKKLEDFCRHLDNGAIFIATHPDKTCPTADGYIPDVGSFLRLIKCVTGKSPSVVCGKPSKEYGKRIVGMTGLKPNQIAMVGDRLTTDMRFAYNSGFRSVLVLSGETKQADLQRLAANKKRLPDIVLNSINEWDK